MRIAVISDAAEPQINGVVHTYRATQSQLEALGHEVHVVGPDGLNTFACPGYKEIRLACNPLPKVRSALKAFQPDSIHIATEGPMGVAARRYCLQQGLDFTTSYHTRFPEYVCMRLPLPKAVLYRWLRWFHAPSKAVMVASAGMKGLLEQRGFRNVVLWSRGVDTQVFRPESQCLPPERRPLYLYVGRVAVEKNIEDFLRLDLPGTKWVIGDGPQRDVLEERYPHARFFGAKSHASLSSYYNCADVLVFPSRTDTFGLVMAEAIACGLPVAAYPVPGPQDVVEHGRSGFLDEDLGRACFKAMQLAREGVAASASRFSWEAATRQFLQHLVPSGLSRLADLVA